MVTRKKTTATVTTNGLRVRKVQRFGWIPDLPDQRDYLYAAPAPFHGAIPAKIDLSGHCPAVYDQGQLGS